MNVQTAIARNLLGMAMAVAFADGQCDDSGYVDPGPPVPGSTAMGITGINDENIVSGQYETPDSQTHSYFGTLDGQYTSFDAPNPNGWTAVGGINNAGYITVLSNYQTEDCRFIGCEYLRSPDGNLAAILKAGTRLDGIPWDHRTSTLCRVVFCRGWVRCMATTDAVPSTLRPQHAIRDKYYHAGGSQQQRHGGRAF